MRQEGIREYALLACARLVAGMPQNLLEGIRAVVLFGSVAQGTATEESDIDVFFDTATGKAVVRLKAYLRKAVRDFSLSPEALRLKMAGTSNQISAMAGNLEEWPDLQRSMISTGIVVYSRYAAKAKGLKPFVIFSWEGLKIRSRGAFLNKVYGYKSGKKRYPGLVKTFGGIRIGRSAIMLPLQHKDAFMRLLEKQGIEYRVIEVFA